MMMNKIRATQDERDKVWDPAVVREAVYIYHHISFLVEWI